MSRPTTRCEKCSTLNRHESGETEIICKNCGSVSPTSEDVSKDEKTPENNSNVDREGDNDENTTVILCEVCGEALNT